MRKSQKYNNYVHPETGAEETISLAKHYQYSSHLGDQVSIFLNVYSLFCLSGLSTGSP